MEMTMEEAMDAPNKQTLRDGADGSTATYAAGYADGITLLHEDGRNDLLRESLRRIRARYLSHTDLKHPTPGERAYIDGFRDVACDNLFSPPDEIESKVHCIAA
jgi:hypothetical protein